MNNFPNVLRLIDIMKRLRSPGGCPWDLEQDHKTLKPYLLEETYEVLEAIDEKDSEHLKEELGDLLLQVVFHAQIAQDNQEFTIDDVAKDISDKLVRRHPHVFADVVANDAKTVVKNWDEIKLIEKAQKGILEKSTLDSVGKNFPALFESLKISKKAAKQGFDWKKPGDIFKKIEEEVAECKGAIRSKKPERIEEELGDLLFAVANLCRAYKINPELALKSANQKFRKRFAKMEKVIQKENIKDLTFKKWDQLWERVKKS